MRAARWGLTLLLLAGCGTAPDPGPSQSAAPPGTSAATPVPTTSSTSSIRACSGPPCYGDPVDDGTLPASAPEASGIAASATDPDLYFVVDDGTGADAVTAVRSDGSSVGSVVLDGMDADNAEAVTAGPCPTGRCLYVGDIGGNGGRHRITVYRAPEPTVPLPASVPAETWRYTYPDGGYNAEALLIADDGSVIVVTKPDGGTEPHRIYVGPPGGGDLLLHGTFRPPAPASPSRSLLVGNVVTDATRDEDAVLLLTYDQAVEYRAPAPGADPADFPDWPARPVPTPDQWQSEGVTYRAAGACGYVVVSERSPWGGAAIGSVGC